MIPVVRSDRFFGFNPKANWRLCAVELLSFKAHAYGRKLFQTNDGHGRSRYVRIMVRPPPYWKETLKIRRKR